MAEHTKLMEVAKAVGCDLMLLACGNRKQTTERKAELNKLIPAIKTREIVPLWILEFGKDQVKGAVQESSISQATLTKWVQELKGEDYVAPVTKTRKASPSVSVHSVFSKDEKILFNAMLDQFSVEVTDEAKVKQVKQQILSYVAGALSKEGLQSAQQKAVQAITTDRLSAERLRIEEEKKRLDQQVKELEEKLHTKQDSLIGEFNSLITASVLENLEEANEGQNAINPSSLPEVPKETEKAFLTRVKAEIEKASFNGLSEEDGKHLETLKGVNKLADDLLKRLAGFKKVQGTEDDDSFLDRMKNVILDNKTMDSADLNRLIDMKGKGIKIAAELVDVWEKSDEPEATEAPQSDSKE